MWTSSVREQLPTVNTATLLDVYEGQWSQIHQRTRLPYPLGTFSQENIGRKWGESWI